ncbi:biotin/lipoyl-binding protein [Nocardioidaceae bacterium SCSIO 66511]|nr:biotin/lipoyl-binding protein [Nocardioidaceae bacterium SCSIO 66511]
MASSVCERVLVANRGEIARRVIRTCRRLGIETVAVHSDADDAAPFVREADAAVRLPGNAAADTYLRGDLIVEAARVTGADAIHPGYGFLSENAEFAQAVLDAGLTWIGPEPKTIEQMGSKVRAKEIMAAAGVPVLTAESGSFPMLVKASAGGGGRGMRVVTESGELDAAVAAAEAEALASFGDGTVFVEPYLPTARHIEVQVLADRHGTCWVLGERDCSIQRRHQKVVEETPAPGISDAVRTRLHDAARAAVMAVDYVGAGTVEFLVDGVESGHATVSFLEMNTRLQVEHPVTESVWGVDLVELQIAVAEGRALGTEPQPRDSHAIEVRVYAEDPADDWRAQTGTVRAFEFGGAEAEFANPDAYGVRVDAAVAPGSVVGIHYDAMLAKVVAWAPDRTQAIRMLRGSLRRARVHGIVTNLDLLTAILSDEQFGAGDVHTRLLDDRKELWTAPRRSEAAIQRYATAAALVQAHATQSSASVQSRIPTAFRNVPSQRRSRAYLLGDERIEVSYANERRRFVVDGLDVIEVGGHCARLGHGGVGESYEVRFEDDFAYVDGPSGSVDLRRVPRFSDPADEVAEGSLLAPMPAAVASVAVSAGDQVAKGQTVLVLEAMKMQHPINAPVDGIVAEVGVTAGQQVDAGTVLAVIDEGENEDE